MDPNPNQNQKEEAYTYQPGYQQQQHQPVNQQGIPMAQYPPMPSGYQQYAAAPMPVPGQPGYFPAPQYYEPQPSTSTNPSASGTADSMTLLTANATSVAANPPSAPDTIVAPPPSVFDLDPSSVKRAAYFTGPEGVSCNKNGRDMNTPTQPPVVGYIMTLPLAPTPTMGIAVGDACCSHCKKSQYDGRVVDHSGRLSIVAPTASMSGQDGLSAPMHSLDAELFRPCLCDRFIHRGCFREMRSGLSFVKSRQYYECPTCMFTYKLERIMGGAKKGSGDYYGKADGQLAAPGAQQAMGSTTTTTVSGADQSNDKQYSFLEELEESNVRGYYIRKVLIMWGTAFVTIAAVVAALAGISYALDKDNKNIPVFIKLMFTRVAFGEENRWRDAFRRPDVKVWPYYLGFAVFLSACGMIIVGVFSYLFCVDTNDSEIRPSCCGYVCDNDDDREKEINSYISKRQTNENALTTNLPPAVQAAVVQRQQRRATELRDHYYRQRKLSYWFSCADNSSYYYYDSRPYYYNRRANYYDNRYNGHGRHYYSGGYYRGSSEACCDLCTCCIVCCCQSDHPRHNNHSGGYNAHAGYGSSSSCGCSGNDCNCNSSGGDCNCNGGGDGVAVLLILLLVIVIIIIVSAYVTLLCYLISRTFRLMGVASKLAYIQALEREDHVFALAINESWRPVGTV